jgi:hypothetical protein
MAGPLVATLVGGLEGALVVGGMPALGAALTQIGVTVDLAISYETALKANKYVLMIKGGVEAGTETRSVLESHKDWAIA